MPVWNNQTKQWDVSYVYPNGSTATESFATYDLAMNWLEEMQRKYGG